MSFAFRDFFGWLYKRERLGDSCTRVGPTLVTPITQETACLKWNSTGQFTRVFRNGTLLDSFTPTAGEATLNVQFRSGETAAFDVIESAENSTLNCVQSEPEIRPIISFDPVANADGYRLYYGQNTNKMRRLGDTGTSNERINLRSPISLSDLSLGTRWFFRAETIDGNGITSPAASDLIPDAIVTDLPSPPALSFSIENGILTIVGHPITVLSGQLKHVITARVYDNANFIVGTVVLTENNQSGTLPLADGNYVIRTEQSGGIWTHIYDDIERFIHVSSGSEIMPLPTILEAEAKYMGEQLIVQFRASEHYDRRYRFGVWDGASASGNPIVKVLPTTNTLWYSVGVAPNLTLLTIAAFTNEEVGTPLTISAETLLSRPENQNAEEA